MVMIQVPDDDLSHLLHAMAVAKEHNEVLLARAAVGASQILVRERLSAINHVTLQARAALNARYRG